MCIWNRGLTKKLTVSGAEQSNHGWLRTATAWKTRSSMGKSLEGLHIRMMLSVGVLLKNPKFKFRFKGWGALVYLRSVGIACTYCQRAECIYVCTGTCPSTQVLLGPVPTLKEYLPFPGNQSSHRISLITLWFILINSNFCLCHKTDLPPHIP